MTMNLLLWMENAGLYREALANAGLAGRLEVSELSPNAQPDAAQLAQTELMLAWTVPPGTLAKMPRLKWIQTPNTGVAAWLKRPDLREDIQLSCGRGLHRVQMPENILGALFHITKPYMQSAQSQAKGEWGRRQSIPLAGATLGILGLGAVGQELAKKAAALEMRVIGTRHSARPAPHVTRVLGPEGTDEILAQSDYVVVLLSDTRETENLLDARRLGVMKKSAWLINFARGNIIVDADLVTAVKAKSIAGAVLDVFRTEPLPLEHPFWTTEGIVVLAHLGGGHPDRERLVAGVFVENLRRYMNGEPQPGLVDRSKGY
ncbi:MAG: D-2-hydroxyacid dehydrogenase [Betaproteobacteria bacterium]|nr:D-2-hydroxyacid dehydrogenase [Betaproteobacteria bacterium]